MGRDWMIHGDEQPCDEILYDVDDLCSLLPPEIPEEYTKFAEQVENFLKSAKLFEGEFVIPRRKDWETPYGPEPKSGRVVTSSGFIPLHESVPRTGRTTGALRPKQPWNRLS